MAMPASVISNRLVPRPTAAARPVRPLFGRKRLAGCAGLAVLLLLVVAAAGCQPTQGNDNSFVPSPTTSIDFATPVRIDLSPYGGSRPYAAAISLSSGLCTPANAPNIAVTSLASNLVHYLTNNGSVPSPSFTVTATLFTAFAPWKVIFANLDHDDGLTGCHQDLAILNTANAGGNGYGVTVFLTTDNANFAQTFYPLAAAPLDMAVVDVNNDGFDDIVVSVPDRSQVVALVNDGTGHFTQITTTLSAPGTFFVVKDYTGTAKLNFRDGDSCTDLAIVVPSTSTVHILTTTRTTACDAFTGASPLGYNDIAQVSITSNPQAIAAVDLNGDGWPELVITSTSQSALNVLLNSGASPATFSNFPGTPVPDVNGATRLLVGSFVGIQPSIFVVHPSAGIGSSQTYTGGASGTFPGEFNYSLDATPFDMASGKFRDSYLDIAVSESTKRLLYILKGDGTGRFTYTVIGLLHTPSTPVVQRLRPPSGAAMDIVVPQPFDNSVLILLNVH